MAYDVSIPGAFAGGLLSFASPCILPLVPPFLCYIAGTSMEDLSKEKLDRSRIVLTSFAFVLGFTTIFVALGATASFLGRIISSNIASIGYVAGAIIIAMGLHFLGIIRIPYLYRSVTVQTEVSPGTFVGAYVMGLAFAFGWTPCAGPILATILFIAGAEDSVSRGVWLLLLYSAGVGLPFMIAAMFASYFMTLVARFRQYLGLVEKVMGASLVVTGVVFMTGQMSMISGWLLETFPILGSIG
ncbi:cytochrome c biogenesis CcdA family protein [Bradyrhizobium sp. HKCCYLS2038]|uniref:cytochrome c biogenesis CcdA family protein n=1 Tax=unclassified Bradyrhizobium TaxID=2631580 RepID=UPI003EC0F2BF